MRKFLTLCVLVIAGVFAAAAWAGGSPAPPGQDPCSHGHTEKPCRPDPQPDHGKDCEHHGNQGGVNEDHCSPAPEHPTEPEHPTVTTSEVGEPITVPAAEEPKVSGPAEVEKKGDVVVITPTKPGVVTIKRKTHTVRIGVPDRSQTGNALTG